jgi:putative phage-type endonuclease
VSDGLILGRRATPAARLVQVDMTNRQAWLQARRHGVGSSDVAQILGIWPSPRRVFYEKQGELPAEDDEGTEPRAVRMRMGRRLEAAVAAEWTQRNMSVTRRIGLVAHAAEPWRMCTLDRRVAECPIDGARNACLLECKTTEVWSGKRWRREIPDDTLGQVAHQIYVTGYAHAHVAVQVGLFDYRHFTIHRSDIQDVFEYVAAEVAAFHDNHLITGIPPADLDAELDAMMHPDRAGSVELSPADALVAAEALAAYTEARADEADGKARKDVAKSQLLRLLGPHLVATVDGEEIYKLNEVERDNCDLDLLADRFAEAYRMCVHKKSHHAIDVGAWRRQER